MFSRKPSNGETNPIHPEPVEGIRATFQVSKIASSGSAVPSAAHGVMRGFEDRLLKVECDTLQALGHDKSLALGKVLAPRQLATEQLVGFA